MSQFPILGNQDTIGGGFGGFVGYNTQWESVVIGLEASYNSTTVLGSASGSLTRVVTPGDGSSYLTTVSVSAFLKMRLP